MTRPICIILACVATLAALTACRTAAPASPVPEPPPAATHTATTRTADTARDTIIIRERADRTAGDTIVIERETTRIRDRHRTDTLLLTDSVPVPYYIDRPVEVPAPQPWYARPLQTIGLTALLGLAAALIYGYARRR